MQIERPYETAEFNKFVRTRAHHLGKTLREVSAELGYEKPNVLIMFLHGYSPFPPERIKRLANALDLPVGVLIRLAARTYGKNGMWRFVQEMIDDGMLRI